VLRFFEAMRSLNPDCLGSMPRGCELTGVERGDADSRVAWRTDEESGITAVPNLFLCCEEAVGHLEEMSS
jgi:hypothetical protein